MTRQAWTLDELAGGVRSGDRRALARAISLVENGDPLSYALVRELYPETGSAYVVGVTGPPGVGKSSLISAIVRHVRATEKTIGVISVVLPLPPARTWRISAAISDDLPTPGGPVIPTE